ncbi:helix-turn-helix domain-containing protein [Streptomyces phaeochromogenes]|uniref:helix-turn-helix domain-containing protein n=1 Tax=Streptomyces phaeochromogenes TaxID=1923 RepID=UPI0037165929
MGQQPVELTPDESPWHRWGAELRRSRNARGLSLERLGQRVHVTRSYLSKLERGKQPPSRQIAAACDRELDVCGALVRAWEKAHAEVRGVSNPRVHVSNPRPHVSKTPADLVTDVSEQATSDDAGICIPARLRDGTVVFVALDRRNLLRGGVGIGAATAFGMGTPAAADSNAVPGLLRRARSAAAYGGTPVEHLKRTRRLLIERDNLLGPGQAIKAVRDHIGVIKELRREAKGADRHNLMELQTQYAEFASWLYQDLGDFNSARFWLDRAFDWSHTVGDGELTSYVMARKAQLAGETRDLVDVVDLAEAAQRLARPRSRLAAVARTYESYGHALRGDSGESQRAIDDVHGALDQVSGDPSPWGVWLNSQYVEVHRAQGLEVLGRHDQAADIFMAAIQALPEGYHRDRGVYLARAAVAHVGAGAPEQAAAVGLQALTVAEDTGSGRIFKELGRLDKSLLPWQRQPEVAEFHTAFDVALPHEA